MNEKCRALAHNQLWCIDSKFLRLWQRRCCFFHLSARPLKFKRIFQHGRFSFVIFLFVFFLSSFMRERVMNYVQLKWAFCLNRFCITNRKGPSNEDAKQEHSEWNNAQSNIASKHFPTSMKFPIVHRVFRREKKKWRRSLFNAFKAIFQSLLLSRLMEIHRIFFIRLVSSWSQIVFEKDQTTDLYDSQSRIIISVEHWMHDICRYAFTVMVRS